MENTNETDPTRVKERQQKDMTCGAWAFDRERVKVEKGKRKQKEIMS